MNITSTRDYSFLLSKMDSSEQEKLIAAQRALPESEQKHLVVYFSMLDYHIISAHDTEAEANSELAIISGFAERKTDVFDEWKAQAWTDRLGTNAPQQVAIPGVTREALGHCFDVRTQASLDRLVAAIRSC